MNDELNRGSMMLALLRFEGDPDEPLPLVGSLYARARSWVGTSCDGSAPEDFAALIPVSDETARP